MRNLTVPVPIENKFLGFVLHQDTGEGLTMALSCQDDVDTVVQEMYSAVDDFYLDGLVIIELKEIVLAQHQSALFVVQHCSPYLWKALNGELNMLGSFNSTASLHINHG